MWDGVDVVCGTGTVLCVDNWHRFNLVNKRCIIDKRCLLFDGIQGGTSSPLSFASLMTPVPQADVRTGQDTDAYDHYQDAKTDG